MIIRVNPTDLHFVFAEPYDPDAEGKVRAHGRVTVLSGGDAAELAEALADGDALLIRSKTRVTRKLLEAAPRLRAIGRAGVGLENIDLEAARQRRVAVVYTPGAATDAVADLTLGMMLSLVRRLPWYDAAVRAGRFQEARGTTLRDMNELTVGIVGFGRIGRAVASRCSLGFGMRVLFNDIAPVDFSEFPAVAVSKESLYAESDVVSLNVPLTDLTRGLIGAAALQRFKSGAILLNTSRGEVIDAGAVAEALREGRLAGAGIDVFSPEPPPEGDPLLSTPNTILTPHIGARTQRGLHNMNQVVDDVIRVIQGIPPLHPA